MSPIVWRTGDRQMTSCPCGEVPEALTGANGMHGYSLFKRGNSHTLPTLQVW